jgi:hypothetical protein
MEPNPIQTYRTKSRPEKLNKARTITSFDPEPAAKLAKELLESIKAPFAVIGRIAVWAYLPPEAQEFTKDIDLAVPLECIASIEEQLKKRNIAYRPLVIGGIGTTDKEIHIDFIDRRQYHQQLFREAIDETQKQGNSINIGAVVMPLVPVEFLIALKMVSGEPKDDRDVKRLLEHAELDYKKSRDIVMKHLGPATADRLDVFAREIGRPEVPKRNYYE